MKNYKLKFIVAVLITSFAVTSCGLMKEAYKLISGEDQKKREELKKNGVSANGEITKVEDTNTTINKNPKVRLYVHVTPKDDEPFDAVIEMVVSRVNIPRKGDTVKVWYNPKDKTDIMVE